MNTRSPNLPATSTGATRSRRSGTAAEIRGRLVEAADRLLRERQAQAITSRDIARAAGLSDGVLYNYFADKQELLVTTLVSRLQVLLDAFSAAPSVAADIAVEDSVADLVRRTYELQVSVLPMLANLVGDPPLLHRFMTEIHQPPLGGDMFLRQVADHLAAEQRLGRIGSFDPAAAADVLVGAVLMQGLVDVLGHRTDVD
ncbi:MAG: TetR/AcrR family transcriptional regulator, partial [Candidatus Limnocylindrales bacterium]